MPVFKMNGGVAESSTSLLDTVEWYVALQMLPPAAAEELAAQEVGEAEVEAAQEEAAPVAEVEAVQAEALGLTVEQCQAEFATAVSAVLAMDQCMVEKPSKRKKGKSQQVRASVVAASVYARRRDLDPRPQPLRAGRKKKGTHAGWLLWKCGTCAD